MDKLLDTLNQYLSAASATLSKYGPAVWDATLSLVRIQAIFNLVGLALVTIGCCLVAWSWHAFLQRRIAARPHDDWGMGYIAMIFPGAGLAVSISGWLCSFDDWLGLFDPRLAILYRLAHKAGVL